MLPQLYKASVMGNWQAWVAAGQVDMNRFEEQRVYKPQSMATGVYVNGVWVYALDFGDEKEWNVAHGWTK